MVRVTSRVLIWGLSTPAKGFITGNNYRCHSTPEEDGTLFAKTLDKERVLYIRTDITDSAVVKAAIDKAVETYGNLKGLVHCAGIARRIPWTNDLADSIPNFELELKVNTVGTFIVNAHFADAVNKPLNHPNGAASAPFWTTDEERGVIINFSSISGHQLYSRCVAYGPTKAGVTALTQSISDFLGPSGIRVNAVSPSVVLSGLTAGHAKFFEDSIRTHATFPRRTMVPADIVPTVIYIIENEILNGVDIGVDSGWKLVMQKPTTADGPDPRELAPGLE